MTVKTVSFEMAKKLKEDGFRKDTEMYWYSCPTGKTWDIVLVNDNFKKENGGLAYTSAPTSDELLEEFPNSIFYPKRMGSESNFDLIIRKNKDSYGVSYQAINTKIVDHFIKGKNIEYWWDYAYATCHNELPEALASMWIWLKEAGNIK